MKNKSAIPTSQNAVEFLTVFGFSLLLTLAGLHYLEMLPSQQDAPAQEINYATADELLAPPPAPALSVEALGQLLEKYLP